MRRLFLQFSVVAAAVAASVWQGQAQVVTLAHNNSVATIDTSGSSAGMNSWAVEGQNQLAKQWFWYRIGNTAEAPINTIGAPSITQPNARTLYTTYNNGSYSVEVDYSLSGGLAGSGFADIGEAITINNYTATPLDFHFFQYSDFNLGGISGGQTIELGKNLRGIFNEALQTAPGVIFNETVVTPGANHGEAGLFSATWDKLNNGVADNLNDNVGPVGPGNATWAFQWDFVIAPGGSVLISKDKLLQVPEPSTLALISLGLAGLALRRRRSSV